MHWIYYTKDESMKPIDDKKTRNPKESFEWKNRMEHILFFLLYLTDYGTIILTFDFSLVPFLVVTIFFGYPIIFFQNFIGQYTRKGCLFLKEMLPVLSGLGYTMFLHSSFTFFTQIFNTSMLLYYLMVSLFNSSPPWMRCYPSFYTLFPNCFSKKDFDLCSSSNISKEPCFPPGSRTLSSYIFKEVVAFGRISKENETSDIYYSELANKFASNVLGVMLVCIPLIGAAHINMKALFLSLRITASFAFAVLLTVSVLVVTAPGVSRGFIWWYKAVGIENTFSFSIWVEYFEITIQKLKLAEGFYILFGSFISKSNPERWRSMHLILAYIIITIISSVYYNFFIEEMHYKLHMELEIFQSGEENAFFITIPTYLGIQASSYFFSVIIYLMLTTLSFHSLLIKLIVMEKTLTVQLNIPQYSYYVRIGICLFAITLAIFMSLPGGNIIIYDIQALFCFHAPIAVGLLIITIWLYGLKKLCDDIEYLLKSKTQGFVKLGWVLTPLLCVVCGFMNIQENLTIDILTIVFFVIITGIFLICLICKIFSLAIQKNLMELLKSTDEFGPPEIEDRIQRILHNPSLEVKYKRQLEVCKHDCLLNCNAVKIALNEELDQLSKLIEELPVDKSFQTLDEKFISHLEKYRKYLLKMIELNKTKNEEN